MSILNELENIIEEEKKVKIVKSGKGDFIKYNIISFNGSKLIDMDFDSEEEAKKYANKKGMQLEGNIDPKAKVRNKPNPVFSDKGKDVTDKKDHYPLGSVAQARNALARAGQMDKNPSWHNGTLTSLKKKVKSAVKKEYPSIDVSESTLNKANSLLEDNNE